MDKQTATEITRHLKVLFSAFPVASRADELLAVKTYIGVLEDYSLEAVARSVRQFVRGEVPTHDGRFVPSAAELARNVRQWDEALTFVANSRAALPLASGILKVDFGNGSIDMTKLTLAEQDEVLRTGRAPGLKITESLNVRLQGMNGKSAGFSVGNDAEGEAA